MKKSYKIEVDCANCANMMEDAAKKTEGVKDCTVSFMTQKMMLNADDNRFSEIVALAQKAISKVDPECKIKL